MILETVSVGGFQVNCYILAESDNLSAIIIDPGDEPEKIKKVLAKHGLKPGFIVNTHGHIDHIGADDEFGVDVYVHAKDAPMLNDPSFNLSSFLSASYSVKSQVKTIEDGQSLELGNIRLEVIHTPGHTPGGICLLLKSQPRDILFTGDTLFRESIGRTDFTGADARLLISSIRDRLMDLPEDTLIFPGHGPSSSLGYEKENNPFLE